MLRVLLLHLPQGLDFVHEGGAGGGYVVGFAAFADFEEAVLVNAADEVLE